MTKKRWLKTSFISVVLMIFIIGLFNYIIDPFHQYRVKTFYPIAYTAKLQRYINPGFAKNYDYDTVILGSSTSENFIISDVKEILDFKKPIKLCISGTSAYEESLTLQTALKHQEVRQVLYGLDSFLFWGKPKRTRHGEQTFPFYLYDDNLLNDYKYIFSIDTSIKSFKSIITPLYNKNDIEYNYNRMYEWQTSIPKQHFSTKHLMKVWEKRDESDLAYQPNNSFPYYKKSFDTNFLTIFKKYPKTNFILYFPPYSVLAYKYEQEKKVFQERLKFKKYIFEATQDLKNVQIYDFQIAKEVTHNLNNYHDLDHYHQKINKWILEQIKDNNFRVNQENIDAILKKHENQVNKYKIVGEK